MDQEKKLNWEKVEVAYSEFKIDKKWILKDGESNKIHGSLRIVSHPNLPPGYLKAYFTDIISEKDRSMGQVVRTVEDYQISESELEIYSIDKDITTKTSQVVEAKYKLEQMFNVKI